MSKTKSSIISQIVVAVVVALLIGGSSPWWWNEIFKSEDKPPANNKVHRDIAGVWKTNVPNLVYLINQTGNKYTWKIPNGASGPGRIVGRDDLYSMVGKFIFSWHSEAPPAGRSD